MGNAGNGRRISGAMGACGRGGGGGAGLARGGGAGIVMPGRDCRGGSPDVLGMGLAGVVGNAGCIMGMAPRGVLGGIPFIGRPAEGKGCWGWN